MKVLWLILIVSLFVGCASEPQRLQSPALPDPIAAKLVLALEPPLQPVNVGIKVFDVDAVTGSSLYGAQRQVRSVEQRYLPYQLKKTLDRSGYWGAVRVMPRKDLSAELNISGWLIESDGVVLKLAVRAVDAAGRVWLDRIYQDSAVYDDYAKDADYNLDPFQDLYNELANDLSGALKAFNDTEIQTLLDVATVVYGSTLSEEAFGRYLQETDQDAEPGTEESVVLVGLPAKNDPTFLRIQRIRESEYLFADSIDAHYESLQRQLGQTYAWWRHYSYELIMGNRQLENVDATRGATRGTFYSLDRVYKTYQESKMNEDALRELTTSFDRETEPTVTEIAGKVVQLNGTLDFQVDEWRRLLKQAWDAETGF